MSTTIPAGPHPAARTRAATVRGHAPTRAIGEDRLYMLSAWRESPLYSPAERAALALCEAMTLIADGGVPDQVWEDVATHFDEEQRGQLLFSITVINAWNRLMITAAAEPGHYEPGMFD